MAVSNLRTGLQRRYARWLGERSHLAKEVKDIEEAIASLDGKKQRLSRLDELTRATETLMSELHPDWKPEDTQPLMTNRQHLPWEHGATTSTAFDIIRELKDPISTKELSKLTIAQLGGDPEDPDLLDRVRSNLDNSLRNHSAYIKNVGGRPSRWQIIPADEMEMPKPPA